MSDIHCRSTVIYASCFRADPSAAISEARREDAAVVVDGRARPLALILSTSPRATAWPTCEPDEGR